MTADGKIEIMIASTVYEFEDQIDQVCGLFQQKGYHPVNSHYKTMPVDPAKSNLENCLEAVRKCDCIFGIIRPHYGSGILGSTSITHEEMKLAIAIKKPRWFIAHHNIKVARILLKQYMYRNDGALKTGFKYRSTGIMDDIRLLQLYNDTILNDTPPTERIGNWTDNYFSLNDIFKVIQTQFEDRNRILEIIDKMKAV
jgi:hypothetical protein